MNVFSSQLNDYSYIYLNVVSKPVNVYYEKVMGRLIAPFGSSALVFILFFTKNRLQNTI